MDDKNLLDELNANIPRFPVSSSDIEILDSPKRFHDALVSKISSATRRIFLTSLYIGSDAHVLRHALRNALRSNAQLKLYILIDKLRGSRTDPGCSDAPRTCISLLAPLIQEFGAHRVEIRCYQTPKLRGLWRYLIPQRLNEGFGLQHIKLCGIDDEVIVTGANFSREYFTNRQDRYYIFRSAELTDYFYNLVVALGKFSYMLSTSANPSRRQEHTFEWPSTNYTQRPLEQTSIIEMKSAAQHHLVPILWRHRWEHSPFTTTAFPQSKPSVKESLGGEDTVVYPLAQLTPLLGVSCDVISKRPLSTHGWALSLLLAILPRCSSWTLSTPYLSFPDRFSDTLISLCSKRDHEPLSAPPQRTGAIITASSEAMSFHGARGLAGYIPRAFTTEATNLLQRIAEKSSSLKLLQWKRGIAHESDGWTFHAKGWWVECGPRNPTDESRQDNQGPSIVMMGSSNYGQRSFTLDLEVDVLLVTTNKDLKERIKQERKSILANSEQTTIASIDKGGFWEGVLVWMLMWLIQCLGLSI